MTTAIPQELQGILADLQAQLAALNQRLARLEKDQAVAIPGPAAAPAVPAPETTAAPAPEASSGISEQDILAISAALAAFFGVRVRIRQIRLISSRAWAQEGRVSVQASHRLHS